MNFKLINDKRYCDRQTAIELGGEEYRDTSIKTLLYFDEYITIDDNVFSKNTKEEK